MYLGNFLETLADLLIEQLFQGTPFTRRLVVLPDSSLKNRLMGRIAEDPRFHVAAGIEFTSLGGALGLPSVLEISLFLECEVRARFDEKEFAPLKAYLEGPSRDLRLMQLCDRLSRLFLQYALHGGKELSAWEQSSGWQPLLWRLVSKRWPRAPLHFQQIHLFGFSSLSESLVQLFKMRGAHFYFFSPCQVFWGDYYSKKEKLSIEGGFDEMQHPLLASLGRIGRKMQLQFAEEQLEEFYDEPEGESALLQLQRQILQGEKIEELIKDESIQLFSAPSRWSEVEILHKKIHALLQSGLQPRDIQVFAPDIALYAPYIRTVFTDIDVAIEDLPLGQVDPLLQGLDLLLNLPEKRFERGAVLELLGFPLLMEKFDWSEGEVARIQQWCRDAHVRSWQEGMERLLYSLMETQSPIDQSEIELFDAFYRLIADLQEDLKEQTRTISEWADHFVVLIERYFMADSAHDLLRHLKRISAAFADKNDKIAFENARRILDHYANRRSATVQPPHLQAVRFSSLSQGCVWPSAAICLLGMHEDAFPRPSERGSLAAFDLPSRSDEDRYLFLQLICSARSSLLISYPRSEGEELNAALPVQELGLPIEELEIVLEKKEKISAPLTSETALPTVIDLRKLSKLAKDPQKFFLSEALRIYDRDEEEEGEEFVYSALKRYILCKEALKTPLEELLEKKQKEFPMHLFGEAAQRRISEDFEQQLKNLEDMGVTPSQVFSIKLSQTCKEKERLPNGDWIFPACKIGDVLLVGTIDEVTPKGPLMRTEGTFADQVKAWPAYLVYCLLMPEGGKEMLFLKKARRRQFDPKDPQKLLESFLNYYAQALLSPSPLEPESIEAVLSGESTDNWTTWAHALYEPLRSAYGRA